MSNIKEFKIENGILKKYYGKNAEVTIPDGVISISSYAFARCEGLRKVTIPQGVNRICLGAFYRCHHLQEIVIPDGVKTIGKWAFLDCYSVKRLVIPSSIKQIGERAFFKQMSLNSCVLAPNSEDAEQAKMILSALTLSNLWFPFLKGEVQTNAMLEQTLIKKMASKAFRARKIPLLIQNDEIEAFQKFFSFLTSSRMSPEELDAYVDCSLGKAEFTNYLIAYRNARYPMEKVLEMQQEDMEKALGLREKTLADYRKDFTIVKKDGLCTITGYKGKAATVVIPGEIQGIPVIVQKHAFLGCSQVETIYIEDGMTCLTDGMFGFCRNLKKVQIPHSVRHIESLCFDGCYRLQEIEFNGTKEEWRAISSLRYISICDIICTDGKLLFHQ